MKDLILHRPAKRVAAQSARIQDGQVHATFPRNFPYQAIYSVGVNGSPVTYEVSGNASVTIPVSAEPSILGRDPIPLSKIEAFIELDESSYQPENDTFPSFIQVGSSPLLAEGELSVLQKFVRTLRMSQGSDFEDRQRGAGFDRRFNNVLVNDGAIQEASKQAQRGVDAFNSWSGTSRASSVGGEIRVVDVTLQAVYPMRQVSQSILRGLTRGIMESVLVITLSVTLSSGLTVTPSLIYD